MKLRCCWRKSACVWKGNRWMLAQVLYDLGHACATQCRYEQAENALVQSLTLAQDLNDPFLVMHATARLGICATYQGDAARALPLLQTSLTWMRQQGTSSTAQS